MGRDFKLTPSVNGTSVSLTTHGHDALDNRPAVTTGALTYYIDASSGSDSNNGTSSGTAWATWGKARTMIPRRLAHAVIVYIIGNYSSAIEIADYVGESGGSLILAGSTGVAANHTLSNSLYVTSVHSYCVLLNLKFTNGVVVSASQRVELNTVTINTNPLSIYGSTASVIAASGTGAFTVSTESVVTVYALTMSGTKTADHAIIIDMDASISTATETYGGMVVRGWSSANPAALGTAAAGTARTIAHSDHVHPTTGLVTQGTLVFNVKNYGATGDGSTDDYAAITSCITASTQGSTVFFPPGTYITSAIVSLRESRRYLGSHREMCTVKMQAAANLDAVMASEGWLGSVTASDNPTIVENLGIDGNRTNQSSGAGHGLAMLTFWDWSRDLEIVNCRGDGLHLTSARQDTTEISGTSVEHHIFHCDIRNCTGYGIRVYDPTAGTQSVTDGWIRDCIVQNVGEDGIRVDSSAGWIVEGSHLYTLPKHGIHMGRADSTRVIGNYVESWGTSASAGTYGAIVFGDGSTTFIGGSNPSAIVGNTAFYSSGAAGGSNLRGIIAATSSSTTSHLAIVGNALYSNGFFVGIRLVNQSSSSNTYATVSGNQLAGWAANSNITVSAASGGMVVTGDMFPAALATSATEGFGRLPTVTGTPSGTPASIAEGAAVVADTNGQLWAYVSSAWKSMVGNHSVPFARSGTLSVVTGKGRFKFPTATTILGVSATVDTAPVGAAILVDVNKIPTGSNTATTLYTTQGNRPTIADGGREATETTPNVTAFAAGDMMTVDVDQIGSTTPGSDLTVTVRYRPT